MREARTDDEVAAATRLRRRVFFEEQGVGVAERDGMAGTVVQVVAFGSDGRLVGTCRLVVASGLARLGWFALDPQLRGRGAGAQILTGSERLARHAGASRVRLHARLAALQLYERGGYVARSGTFVVDGIEHVSMEKALA